MVQRSATPVIAVPLAHYKNIAQQSVAPHFDCAQAEGSPPGNSLVTQKAESEEAISVNDARAQFGVESVRLKMFRLSGLFCGGRSRMRVFQTPLNGSNSPWINTKQIRTHYYYSHPPMTLQSDSTTVHRLRFRYHPRHASPYAPIFLMMSLTHS